MDEGFLRLSRKFFSNEMWKVARKFSECEAWLDLIQSARFEATDKAYSELIGGREISYTRGQYPASVSFLMKRWQWSEKKVRYFLAKLKKRGMITTCNKQGMTVITLCNYDEYNPVKGRQRDVDKGIDNNKEISGLNHALGELRAELRATPHPPRGEARKISLKRLIQKPVCYLNSILGKPSGLTTTGQPRMPGLCPSS